VPREVGLRGAAHDLHAEGVDMIQGTRALGQPAVASQPPLLASGMPTCMAAATVDSLECAQTSPEGEEGGMR